MTGPSARKLPRLILGGIFVASVIGGVAFAAIWPGQALALSDRFCAAVREAGPLGVIIFALAQILIALSGALPAALLGAAAGAIYGVGYGFAVASVSTLLGAQLAFHASRGLLREFAQGVLEGHPRLKDLDATLAKEGWRIVCLLRVSPVMPFSATSFALGLSSVRPRDYAIGTLASMPALFGYVVLGALTKSGLEMGSLSASPLRLAMLAVGIVATLILTLKIGQILRSVGLFSIRPRLSDA